MRLYFDFFTFKRKDRISEVGEGEGDGEDKGEFNTPLIEVKDIVSYHDDRLDPTKYLIR